jgi:hypothetical protein
MVLNDAAIFRRASIASAEYRPCLNALVLPLGAPGDFRPCSRHRPFGIAGDWHRLPCLVRAPHRCLSLPWWFFLAVQASVGRQADMRSGISA